jgi:hypothetical protein
MKKFLKSYKFAAADLGATLADGLKFGLGGLNNRKSTFEVLPPGFAQELRAGAVFLLLDAFHLLDHLTMESRARAPGAGQGTRPTTQSAVRSQRTTCDFPPP